MPSLRKLISVFEEAYRLLALPDNNFVWSSWEDSEDALTEIDAILAQLQTGVLPNTLTLAVLFAPTGPIQEVSLSSGWGDDFIALAIRFDDAMASDDSMADEHQPLNSPEPCSCFVIPLNNLIVAKELGMDSRFAEVSVFICRDCGQHWLKYFYEIEAVTGSGRWYLGAITSQQFSSFTVEQAKGMLEGLKWYYYGGSYYEGQNGKSAGKIILNP